MATKPRFIGLGVKSRKKEKAKYIEFKQRIICKILLKLEQAKDDIFIAPLPFLNR